MAETVTLEAIERQETGTRKVRRLRRQKLLPAIVYGHKEPPRAISVKADEFLHALRHGTRLVDLRSAGKKELTLIREVQWDVYGQEVLHVDFVRVSRTERIHVSVTLEIKGEAPGVQAGGVLTQQLHALEIECAATEVPDSIRVDVSTLQMGESMLVKDLQLPEGVVALDDPDAVVVTITEPAGEPEEEEAAAEIAEPEVVGREESKEEGEED